MSQDAALCNGAVDLHFSREEAELVVEALRTLANSRRFAFKEPQEDVRQLHAQLFDLVERVENEVRCNGK
jgi:hypothetical protein